MSRKQRKVDLPRPELNITAMMDLVLNLITFFVLVANFNSQTLPTIEIAKPDRSVAKAVEAQERLAVTVVADPNNKQMAKEVKAGVFPPYNPEALKGLTDMLKGLVQQSPNVQVDLRADKNLRYDQVSTVMQAVASAGISKINLVAEEAPQP